jgi:NAD-dependent deacetylase
MEKLSEEREKIERVISILKHSRRLLFITGAGLSADSGLPTYRGVSGLYSRKLTEEGMAIEEALSGQTLRRRPEIAWKYIYQIEEACRGANFNRGHEVIAAMEGLFDQVWVLTQNIDGFHRAAGSKNVIDIHGDIHRLRCMRCDYRAKVEDYSELTTIPPHCPECDAIVRPEVVFFGELLPEEKCRTLYRELERGFDVIFTVGTSSVFPYIAQPVIEARRMGAATVEINPDDTEVTPFVEVKIRAGAAEALGAIWGKIVGSSE